MSIRRDLDKGYTFPSKMPLQKRLKDVLEENVDEKFYLSDKTIESFLAHNEKHIQKNTGFLFALWSKEEVANTIRANGALSATDNTIIEPCYFNHKNLEIEKFSEISCTICARDWKGITGNQTHNAVFECDNVNILFNIYGRDKGSSFAGNVYDRQGDTPCLNTSQGGNREPMIVEPLNSESDGTSRTIKAQYAQSSVANFVRDDSFGSTGVIVYDDYNNQIRADQDTVGSITTKIGDKGLRTGTKLIDAKSFRIRKLTPKECWRLMGFDDSDIDVCIEKGLSNSQLYKMAGNSIVVNVLEKLLDCLYNPKPVIQSRLFV